MDTTEMPSVKKDQQTAVGSSPKRIRRFIDLFRYPQEFGFEKQRKQAIYNLVAFSAFFIFIITVIACYLILQQFLRCVSKVPNFQIDFDWLMSQMIICQKT